MRKFNILAFDDFISGAGTTVYTRPELFEKLAEVDKLALFPVTDQVTTAGSLTVRIQHSGDGLNWVNKNATAEVNGVAIKPSSRLIYSRRPVAAASRPPSLRSCGACSPRKLGSAGSSDRASAGRARTTTGLGP